MCSARSKYARGDYSCGCLYWRLPAITRSFHLYSRFCFQIKRACTHGPLCCHIEPVWYLGCLSFGARQTACQSTEAWARTERCIVSGCENTWLAGLGFLKYHLLCTWDNRFWFLKSTLIVPIGTKSILNLHQCLAPTSTRTGCDREWINEQINQRTTRGFGQKSKISRYHTPACVHTC